MGEELGGPAAAEFFEWLGEPAGDAEFAVGKVRGADVEGLEEPMRGLEEDAGLAARGGGAEIAFASTALRGQEAAVVELSAGKPVPMSAVRTALRPGMMV